MDDWDSDSASEIDEIDSSPSPAPSFPQQEEAGDQHFKIPNLKKGYKTLLAATEADCALGRVQEIKCRLCPHASFRRWEDYKRHCDTAEAHPLRISFCERCGDYFARVDSLDRHRKKPPTGCLGTARERADAKRRETEKVHQRFIEKLDQCLSSGEEVESFSLMIKDMYPDSSKKKKRTSRRMMLSQLTDQ
jgi:hypothetical protein